MAKALSDHPEVIDARQRREAAERALARAIKDGDKTHTDLTKFEDSAAMAICNGKVAQKPNGELHAIAQTEEQIKIANLAVQRMSAAEVDALDKASEEFKEQVRKDFRETVAELDKALAKAAAINLRLYEIHQQGHAVLGRELELEPLHWPELLEQPHVHESRLSHWRRAAGLG
jgi:hypothetical protein